MHPSRYIIIMSLIGVSLAACSGVKTEAKYPERRAGDRDIVYAGEREGIFGKGGIGLFNKKKDNDAVGITVNAYLWRAALDTVSFMPMASADPFHSLLAGGVVAWLVVQTIINVGGVTGLMPVTGLTLPFFSAGGSSLFVTLTACGLLLNVARNVR